SSGAGPRTTRWRSMSEPAGSGSPCSRSGTPTVGRSPTCTSARRREADRPAGCRKIVVLLTWCADAPKAYKARHGNQLDRNEDPLAARAKGMDPGAPRWRGPDRAAHGAARRGGVMSAETRAAIAGAFDVPVEKLDAE